MKSAIELLGLGLIVVGIGIIYMPAGIIVAGLGLVFWAQGETTDDSTGNDRSRRP